LSGGVQGYRTRRERPHPRRRHGVAEQYIVVRDVAASDLRPCGALFADRLFRGLWATAMRLTTPPIDSWLS
jgi:hypothetical protein